MPIKHLYSGEKAGLEDGNADLSPPLGKHLRFGDWRQRRKINGSAIEESNKFSRQPQAAGDAPKRPQNGPFRAVRGHELLPNIEIFIPTVFPASCCGALRSKTPIIFN